MAGATNLPMMWSGTPQYYQLGLIRLFNEPLLSATLQMDAELESQWVIGFVIKQAHAQPA